MYARNVLPGYDMLYVNSLPDNRLVKHGGER